MRLVLDNQGEHASQWAAITSIASKMGCKRETLRRWVIQAERDAGERPGLTTSEREELKKLQRENFELPGRTRAPSRSLPALDLALAVWYVREPWKSLTERRAVTPVRGQLVNACWVWSQEPLSRSAPERSRR